MINAYQQAGQMRDHQTHRAILPLTETCAATSNAQHSNTLRRSGTTATPSALASLSLSDNRLIRQRNWYNSMAAMPTGTASSHTLCQLAVAKLPNSQNTMLGNVSSVSARY